MKNIVQIVKYVVKKSDELKKELPEVVSAPVEFACIFCQTEEEYKNFVDEITPLGEIVERTPRGNTYFLNNAIQTVSGPLRFVKVRKPDPLRPERGDADFNTNYEELNKKYKDDPRFELIERENFEYLRYSNPDYNVMACFSDIPKSKVLGISL